MTTDHIVAADVTEDLLKLSLKQNIRIEEPEAGQLLFRSEDHTCRFDNVRASVKDILKLLPDHHYSKTALGSMVFERDGFNGLNHLTHHIARLEAAGYLIYTLVEEQTVFCHYEQMTGVAHFHMELLQQEFRLSGFAFIRREGDHFLLESSTGQARIIICDQRVMDFIGILSSFKMTGELAVESDLSANVLHTLIKILHSGNFLEYNTTSEIPLADELWNFHDLLFHTRTRYGRHNYNLGGTYRFIGKRPPKTAIRKEANALAEIALPVPADEELSCSKTLNSCLEERQSTRHFNGLDLHKLGLLLYRCLRVKGTRPYEVQNAAGDTEEIELLNAPYPSGGGMYELHFYLTIYDCEGLEPGFYHYNGFDHSLSLLHRRNNDTDAMMWYARACMGSEAFPPAVITFSADFERMFWKYEHMAYAAILKNVGVIFQTLYLVATDLGLGACAIGNGNIEVLKNLTGKPLLQESSVGEFILGNPVKN